MHKRMPQIFNGEKSNENKRNQRCLLVRKAEIKKLGPSQYFQLIQKGEIIENPTITILSEVCAKLKVGITKFYMKVYRKKIPLGEQGVFEIFYCLTGGAA